jgi:hypothetical protein
MSFVAAVFAGMVNVDASSDVSVTVFENAACPPTASTARSR